MGSSHRFAAPHTCCSGCVEQRTGVRWSQLLRRSAVLRSSDDAQTAQLTRRHSVRLWGHDVLAAAAPAAAPVAPAAPIAPVAPAPVASGPVTTVSDGTYQVGTDMTAGRYKTTGPDGSGALDMCYVSRNKDDSGEFDAIIANQIVQGPGSVTVSDGEFAEFSGGCTWTKQ